MLHGFNSELDRRLTELRVDAEVRQQLEEQRSRLAAVQLPANLDLSTKMELERTIDEAFVFGFRLVSLGSAALALLSSVSAWLLIDGKKRLQN